MNNILTKFLLVFSLVLFFGCGTKETQLSESEKKLTSLANETYGIIQAIGESESRYAAEKSSGNWKQAYQTKRQEIENLQITLQAKIKEGRFLEELPEEGTRNKAQLYLHAAENIRMYITVTNADMTKIFTDTPPPATDVYNRERYLTSASAELQKIISGNVEQTTAGKEMPKKDTNRGRYFLHEQNQEQTRERIQRAPAQAESWKEEVESAEKGIKK